jgi:ABC-type branched-subunit amino acid transport system ATPase component
MLELENVVVRFGGVRPLDDLTVTLAGRMQGLIGPNGAGKTTLLNVVSGFVAPASGRLAIDGASLLGWAPGERARRGIRRTFQSERLAENLTARDNVMVMADATERRGRRRTAVDDACMSVGLRRPDRPARALDGLDRKLCELARALVGRPRVVLLDEPAGGLGEAEVGHVRDVLLAVQAQGDTALVVVDHDVELISTICDSVAVLDYGRLLASGPCGSVLNDERVREAWLGKAEAAT